MKCLFTFGTPSFFHSGVYVHLNLKRSFKNGVNCNYKNKKVKIFIFYIKLNFLSRGQIQKSLGVHMELKTRILTTI